MDYNNQTLCKNRINECLQKIRRIQNELEFIKSRLSSNLIPPRDSALRCLDMPKRITHTLIGEGIDTVGDLLSFTPEALSALPGVGIRSVENIQSQLKNFGYTLSK